MEKIFKMLYCNRYEFHYAVIQLRGRFNNTNLLILPLTFNYDYRVIDFTLQYLESLNK